MLEIKYSGKIFVIEHDIQPNGKVFEYAHRSPGVRAIIRHKNEILLTREFRESLNAWDIRLPGGKVFDTLQEYMDFISTGQDIQIVCKEALKREIAEEAGVQAENSQIKYFAISKSGATVKWDLYYFLIQLNSKDQVKEQNLKDTEQVIPVWFNIEDLRDKVVFENMSEERSAMMLLRYLYSNRQN